MSSTNPRGCVPSFSCFFLEQRFAPPEKCRNFSASLNVGWPWGGGGGTPACWLGRGSLADFRGCWLIPPPPTPYLFIKQNLRGAIHTGVSLDTRWETNYRMNLWVKFQRLAGSFFAAPETQPMWEFRSKILTGAVGWAAAVKDRQQGRRGPCRTGT